MRNIILALSVGVLSNCGTNAAVTQEWAGGDLGKKGSGSSAASLQRLSTSLSELPGGKNSPTTLAMENLVFALLAPDTLKTHKTGSPQREMDLNTICTLNNLVGEAEIIRSSTYNNNKSLQEQLRQQAEEVRKLNDSIAKHVADFSKKEAECTTINAQLRKLQDECQAHQEKHVKDHQQYLDEKKQWEAKLVAGETTLKQEQEKHNKTIADMNAAREAEAAAAKIRAEQPTREKIRYSQGIMVRCGEILKKINSARMQELVGKNPLTAQDYQEIKKIFDAAHRETVCQFLQQKGVTVAGNNNPLDTVVNRIMEAENVSISQMLVAMYDMGMASAACVHGHINLYDLAQQA